MSGVDDFSGHVTANVVCSFVNDRRTLTLLLTRNAREGMSLKSLRSRVDPLSFVLHGR